ncbi:DNA repair helicase family protein [Listeria floridensis FSL S10-1187]|uniref:DNA repair helicase family protein n=1 Tax=Listeria floridensis FSL S10-1187 TaxID=1265817 RepID=A0ABN0RDF0_9LIST|nr:ATP-dependent DNA helicase [Listeria floridensis]EUJ28842.1 DNA repair helicase family protein [Listeria floridensis FSL S10-1187]
MGEVRISVRKLVEFVLKSGSIDSRMGDSDAAFIGAKIHRKLQKEADEGYESEVALAFEQELDGIRFCVHGRADGIIDGEVIDEIKTTKTALGELPEGGYEVHWAQAILYGYFYASEHGLSEMTIQLTYYHLAEEVITRLQRQLSLEEMQRYFLELLGEFAQFAVFMHAFKKERNETIKQLSFPYPEYRKGQRELSIAVYRTIAAEEKLFSEAPTGIGKTMSTLFPAIKAIGEGKTDKLFYLTAKTATRQVAEDAARELRKQQMRLKSVTLTAKDKICFLTERSCNPDDCSFANGYFDRVNLALFDLLKHEDCLSRDVIEEYARRHTVCPFELSLDAALFCDLIICDYNYLFDPTVYLRRFFVEASERYTFLIDEAHNLVDRAKSMYTATLSKQQVLAVKRQISKQETALHQALNNLNRAMITFRKACEAADGELVQTESVSEFNTLVEKFTEAASDWLPKNLSHSAHPDLLELFFAARLYCKIAEFYDEHYVTLIQTGKDTTVTELCLDPSKLVQNRLDFGAASILFSATFSPLRYYAALLGGEEDTSKLKFPSPFPDEHLAVLPLAYIGTSYKKRESSYDEIADALFQMIQAHRGNYLFFFPSYAYMTAVHTRFLALYPDVRVQIQEPDMAEEARDAFLNSFQTDTELAGFAILGGVFSEGVDLKGTRLIGTAIISVGLPQPSRKLALEKDYFDQDGGKGFYYAYQIPGMNKVLQAAGRVIRSATDQGVVLLIDERFNEPRYIREFPEHWSNRRVIYSAAELETALAHFWEFT